MGRSTCFEHIVKTAAIQMDAAVTEKSCSYTIIENLENIQMTNLNFPLAKPQAGFGQNGAARYDYITTKLKLYRDAGGFFRETIQDLEDRDRYEQGHYQQNNCYASALGLLVTGNRGVNPGEVATLRKSVQCDMLIANEEALIHTNKNINPYYHHAFLQDRLAKDSIFAEIPVNKSEFFPTISMTQRLNDGRRCHLTYHFVTPHLADSKSSTLFFYSERAGLRGKVSNIKKPQDIVKLFGKNCYDIDVVYAPKSNLGKKAVLIDSRAGEPSYVKGAFRKPFYM